MKKQLLLFIGVRYPKLVASNRIEHGIHKHKPILSQVMYEFEGFICRCTMSRLFIFS